MFEWIAIIGLLVVSIGLFITALGLDDKISDLRSEIKYTRMDVKHMSYEGCHVRKWMALIEEHLKVESYQQPNAMKLKNKK